MKLSLLRLCTTLKQFFVSYRSVCTLSDDESWDTPLRRQTVPWANNNVYTRGIYITYNTN